MAAKLHVIDPSELVAHIEVGQLFTNGKGKMFLLVDRDPWKAYSVRWYWWRELRYQGVKAFFKKKFNTTK